MSGASHDRMQAVFLAACEVEASRRPRYLDEACRGDSELRREVESLLAHDQSASRFLAQPALERSLPSEPASPERIGRYAIRGLLGRGGMGVVYLAEQENPRRTVALKVLRAGITSEHSLRRFEHEASILARLHHPGIAQVYEAGAETTPGGSQPFFALELVEGRALDAWAAGEGVGRRALLELFARVCDAVQHAHQRGVIHRDLKPANVLVDERGDPKVLDFGVARLLDGEAGAAAHETLPGDVLGTLSYMSPEQAGGEPDELDTRTDVYSLGVMLYELLARALPYELSGRTLAEAVRVIQESEPTPPSRRDRSLRGDLETIVLKALEKDHARRYASAAELAADVRRFLADEPIAARPASTVYQLGKLVRRHRAVFGGVAAAFVVALAGGATTTWKWIEARDHEQRAVGMANRADEEARNARAAETLATTRQRAADIASTRAKRISDLLTGMITSIDPDAARGRDTSLLREMLSDLEGRMETELAGEPEVLAELHLLAGQLCSSLSSYDRACDHLARTVRLCRDLEPGAEALLASGLGELGHALVRCDRIPAAEVVLCEALEIRLRLPTSPENEVAKLLSLLADCYALEGDLQSAEEFARWSLVRARGRGVLDPEANCVAASVLAGVLSSRGNHAGAAALIEESLAYARAMFPDEHSSVAQLMGDLGEELTWLGRLPEAERLVRDSIEIREALFAGDHSALANGLSKMGDVLAMQGRLVEAAVYYERCLTMQRRILGPLHVQVFVGLQRLGSVQMESGDLDRAEVALREALVIGEQLPTLSPADLGLSHSRLGILHFRKGDLEAAQREFETAVSQFEDPRLASDTYLSEPLQWLGAVCQERGDLDQAAKHLRHALGLLRQVSPPSSFGIGNVLARIARLQRDRGDLASAEASYSEALAHLEPILGAAHAITWSTRGELAHVLWQSGCKSRAEELALSTLEVARGAVLSHTRSSARLRATLAQCLSGLRRFEEAEVELFEALADAGCSEASTDDMCARLRGALAQLYRAWDRPEDARTYEGGSGR